MQPYEHSAFLHERKNIGTSRSFQFSRGPNFKKKAAHIMEHARDCVRRSLAKAMFAVGGNELWSHREFCV